jgi:hypothetical protein
MNAPTSTLNGFGEVPPPEHHSLLVIHHARKGQGELVIAKVTTSTKLGSPPTYVNLCGQEEIGVSKMVDFETVTDLEQVRRQSQMQHGVIKYSFQKAPRCRATSKRTREPCKAPAAPGEKTVTFRGAQKTKHLRF